jgi:hypothetical protein
MEFAIVSTVSEPSQHLNSVPLQPGEPDRSRADLASFTESVERAGADIEQCSECFSCQQFRCRGKPVVE